MTANRVADSKPTGDSSTMPNETATVLPTDLAPLGQIAREMTGTAKAATTLLRELKKACRNRQIEGARKFGDSMNARWWASRDAVARWWASLPHVA